jgi:hypothetical protein
MFWMKNDLAIMMELSQQLKDSLDHHDAVFAHDQEVLEATEQVRPHSPLPVPSSGVPPQLP